MIKKEKTWDKKPVWLYIICVLVLCFLILPVLIIIPMSFGGAEYLEFPPSSFSLRWYANFFNDSEWLHATWNSITIGFGTMVLSCLLGISAAVGVTMKAMKKGKIFSIILMVPMILPAIIATIAMYAVYGHWKLVGTYHGIVIAHSCLAIPLVVTLVSASLYGLDSRYYDAARSLGATHLTAIRKIVIPLIKPAVLSSMLFAFITSFDESVIALFITRQNTMTLPRMIFDSLKYEISPSVSAVSSLLIFLTILIFVVNAVFKKKAPKEAKQSE